jgi:elongation factor G
MAVEYRSPDIRNIVLLGHGGSGKTTLTDALCYISGSTTRRGQVENGTAHTDFTQEEIDHGISINLAVARAEWMDTKLNLIDTPGYLDFFGEVMAGVRVADGALVVVGATTGVEVGTERCWRAAEARGIPRMVFISMMDRENANFDTAFQQVRNSFGSGAIPVEVPIGSGDHFSGIVNLFSGHAHNYRPNSDKGEYDHIDIPEEVSATVEAYREQLIESIAATDDELLEAYLEGEELDREKVLAGMKQGMARGELFPVFCGSGTTGRGARAVLKKLVELMPAPSEIGTVVATDSRDNEIELEPTDASPMTALVFKTTQEPRVGELSYFRVFTGKAVSGTTVDNAARGSTERFSHLGVPDATARDEVEVLHAGDIGVVAKLKDTHTGDTLSAQGKGLILPGIEWPKADIAIALKPASRGEEDKLANGLAKLHEEDPTFSAAFDPELSQTIARGLGELHLNIALERLARKFGVSVETEPPRIPYRETITRSSEGQGRYKKQTGGRGQFGDCWLRVRPRSRGEGYEFINKIVGGAIPGKFIPAVDKGVKEAADRGVLAGYPVVDFEVECYDGSYHSVDSSEMAFKIAGSMAFQKVVRTAKPILLEPIMTITVRVPEDYMGEVIGDLNQRRGRILGMDADGHWQEVKAHVPLAELYKYSTSLRSLTQGKGLHDREFHGYEPVPSDVTAKVIAEAEARKEADGH